jgi:hypothetical protein
MTELALRKSEERMDIRLGGMNEIRKQLTDQATTFMRQESGDARFTAMNEKLANLERWRAQVEGRGGGASSTIGYIALAISIAIGVLTLAGLLLGGS